jgi:hypothetical protein
MQIRLPASYLRCMTIEPTIMHAAGAGIERTHDAAVIFLDHQGARIRFLDGAELTAVSAAHLDLTELHDTFRVHDKSFTGGFGRSHPDDTPMFAALAQVVLRCGRVLVVGPGSAKNEFVKFMARNCNDALQKHVIGVETVDHPTDGQLVAYARTAFAADDALMQPVGVPARSAQARERTGHPISGSKQA